MKMGHGVYFVGSFQGWNPSITEMLDLDSNELIQHPHFNGKYQL